MLELTTEEENLLNYVGANYAHVVVLINSTNVMELGQIETIPGIDACLIAGLSGSEGATAVKCCGVTANPAGVPPIPGLMT